MDKKGFNSAVTSYYVTRIGTYDMHRTFGHRLWIWAVHLRRLLALDAPLPFYVEHIRMDMLMMVYATQYLA